MQKMTIGVGLLLVIAGLCGFFFSTSKSTTALLPTYMGLVFLALALAALRWRKATKGLMIGGAAFALLALAGSFGGLLQLPALLKGEDVLRPLAVIMRSVTSIIVLVYLAAAAKSFWTGSTVSS